MRQFGLIGYPLSHSFSKKFFTEKFQSEGLSHCHYELFPISSIDHLPDLVKKTPFLEGLNVTIPYKESVIAFLDELHGAAAIIKAVNTIKIVRQANEIKLIGYNTDAPGFERALIPLLKPWHTNALVLGNGGAAKAVCFTLTTLGINWQLVSRKPENPELLSYPMLTGEILKTHTLLINTTPLGMHPHIDSYPPIPYEHITEQHLLFDLVYNPKTTAFLQKGLEKRASISNGLHMLHYQALEAWETWNH